MTAPTGGPEPCESCGTPIEIWPFLGRQAGFEQANADSRDEAPIYRIHRHDWRRDGAE